MKIMCDTNIVLDVLFDRKKLQETSSHVLELCENKTITGMISASCVADIFYIIRKQTGSADKAYRALESIFHILHVADVKSRDIHQAFVAHHKDFEDSLVEQVAFSNKCDYIVTRNEKDFSNLCVPTISPEKLVSLI